MPKINFTDEERAELTRRAQANTVPDHITITKLRCARCNKPFEVVNMDSLTEFFCPHKKCKCRHIKLDGCWYDEVVEKLRALKK